MSAGSDSRVELFRRNAELEAIIQPIGEPAYQCDLPWKGFARGLAAMADGLGDVDLCPDFQRGHVWSEAQQTQWIEAVLRRVIPSSGLVVQFNSPSWENMAPNETSDLPPGFQCLDGLQRITAAARFMSGEISPFGLQLEDLRGSSYWPDRVSFRFQVAVYPFRTRAEVLEHYLALNTGGTVHSDEEIGRVRELLDQARDAT